MLGPYPPVQAGAMWGQGGDLTPCKSNNPTTGALESIDLPYGSMLAWSLTQAYVRQQ